MNELLDLELDEVSLVDFPANKSATVVLVKRDSTMRKKKTETVQDLEKSVCIEIEIKSPEEEQMAEMNVEDNQTKVEGVEKAEEIDTEGQIAFLTSEVERLTKALEEKSEVEKAEEMIDFGGEKVAKSAIPAPVLKKLEEVQKAQEESELRKRADELLPNFAGTSVVKGKLLKQIGDDAELLALLKSADAAFAGLTVEIGKTDADSDFQDPQDKLNALVKARQEDKKEDFYKAYAAVTKTAEGKALLLQTYKK
jgi:uncharacterized small protein (DUF1192 family)